MILSKRLVLAPVLALALTGLSVGAAQANTDPADPVVGLAVGACQLDPATPLTAEQMAPVVVAEADVEVVPGEITAHLVRARVNTSQGDERECTFGVLHRDVLLKQVQYTGSVSVTLGDGLGGTAYSAVTEVEIGNMGIGSAVDPTVEVPLAGFLAPVSEVVTDPSYAISLDRKSIEAVQIAVKRGQAHAAVKQLKAKAKAAAHAKKKQVKAAKAKHAAKAVAAAKKTYAKRVARAQRAYERATSPKTVNRPVSHRFTAVGSVTAG